MRILRSVNRRGFSVGTAGWFTVLKPNTWFPASRLPNTLRPVMRTSETASHLAGPQPSARAVRWSAVEQRPETQHRVRAASAIFGGIAITTFMLWWIMHP